MELDTIVCGDCLDILPAIPDASIDAVITDPPYGTTACKWDIIIPFIPMWAELQRIVKPNAAIVLFSSQPFTSLLITSNMEWFKYCWVWEKTRSFDIFNCKNKPLKKHEDICVFSGGTVANRSSRLMTYNPQGLVRIDKEWKRPRFYHSEHRTHRPSNKLKRTLEFTNYPTSILQFANSNNKNLHPTQKPIALLEYLIRTYTTNESDIILDFAMGSGTTAVAALKLGRHFYGCDIDPEYVKLANQRIEKIRLEMSQMEMALS